MAGEKSAHWANDVLGILLNATALANILQNGASPQANLAVSLHTADPGPSGNQNTSEVAYTGYARALVARTSAGWTITGGSASPANPINFPLCTGGSATATHFAIGQLSSGAGYLFYSGPVTPNISISNGITPQLTTASAVTEA
jgi:hypothetical protein